MLAQEVEAAGEENLFTPTEDEAQDDKAEDAAGDVEGAEPEKCEAKEAVPRRVFPTPDNQRSHNSRTIEWTTTRTGCGVQSAWRDAPQANSTELDEESVRCRRLALTTSS